MNNSITITDRELLETLLGKREARRILAHGETIRLAAQGIGTMSAWVASDSAGQTVHPKMIAFVELSKRLHESKDSRPFLNSPESIFEHLKSRFLLLPTEEMHALYFNSSNILIHEARVSVGSVDQCHVDPREVFAPAMIHRATGVVLAHNHPSGCLEPSIADVSITRQLVAAGKTLCVRVLDHLIVANGQFTSMLNRGMISR